MGLLLACSGMASWAQSTPQLLEQGWEALVKDEEDAAFKLFFKAYQQAQAANDTHGKAEALLHLGMCSFGASFESGLQYATQALAEFKKLENSQPNAARVGRAKCLQLIGTIYNRQRKTVQALAMSHEVLRLLEPQPEPKGTLGLAYLSLAALNAGSGKDSVDFYLDKARLQFEQFHNVAYLPSVYLQLAQRQKSRTDSRNWIEKAIFISDSTQNKQAKVWALLALGRWEQDRNAAKSRFDAAYELATQLSDKLFEIKTLEALTNWQRESGDYQKAFAAQQRLAALKDDFYSLEREKIAKSLELRFEVAEKDRKLNLLAKEREISRLTNFLLVIGIAVLLLASIGGYRFLKSLRKRDQQLLQTKDALFAALEKQRQTEEQQFHNDLDHKESQLSAITLQMLQKNELVSEIKQNAENGEALSGPQVLKMVHKYFASDNWGDFDLYFESLNKNFYTRLKQRYPDISNNDLKICALIKLNLSIKEMASILNISPDSVKTARYRLRKKLQLHTEENLTDFILSV